MNNSNVWKLCLSVYLLESISTLNDIRCGILFFLFKPNYYFSDWWNIKTNNQKRSYFQGQDMFLKGNKLSTVYASWYEFLFRFLFEVLTFFWILYIKHSRTPSEQVIFLRARHYSKGEHISQLTFLSCSMKKFTSSAVLGYFLLWISDKRAMDGKILSWHLL